MTEQEMLKEIKINYLEGLHMLFRTPWVSMPKEDLDWLFEQAEKVEYWRKQHRKRCNELEDAYFKIQLIEIQLHQVQAKAERYEKALEFYANKENYAPDFVHNVENDEGEIAREALELKND